MILGHLDRPFDGDIFNMVKLPAGVAAGEAAACRYLARHGDDLYAQPLRAAGFLKEERHMCRIECCKAFHLYDFLPMSHLADISIYFYHTSSLR